MLIKYFLFVCVVTIVTGNVLWKSNNKFGNKLYKQFKLPKKNLVFSPLALYHMMLIIRESATGLTETAIRKGFKLPDKPYTALLYSDILLVFKEIENLEFANKVYASQGYTYKERFARIIRDYYHTDIEAITKDREEAADDINSWISQHTQDKIHELITTDDFDNSSGLLVVNVVYFKVPWTFLFAPNKLIVLPFYTSPTNSIERKFMTTTNNFDYYDDEELKVRFLKINYRNRRFSIFFALPYNGTGIRDLEDKLHTIEINRVDTMMTRTYVRVAIPKFKITTELNAESALRTAGYGCIFDNNDLTEIIKNKTMHVSKILHKVSLEVSRRGTTATAGTQKQLTATPLAESFIADHPFIFFLTVNIVPDKTALLSEQAVLFMGKVYKP